MYNARYSYQKVANNKVLNFTFYKIKDYLKVSFALFSMKKQITLMLESISCCENIL